ncbi:MAG: hypothetical protein F4Y03_12190 [Alphaproteobacteria bacterium]|nr:hypothetical protein [Alphaproteobacteria bacterium]
MIAILAVGVALAGLMLRGQHSLDKRVDELRSDLTLRIDGLDARLRSVETGLAEVKGQLAIVRDYITGRNAGPRGERGWCRRVTCCTV